LPDKHPVRLGVIQETLLIPLAARALEAGKRRPVLHDPKAVEILDSIDYDVAESGTEFGRLVTVLRTATVDTWVRAFLAEHPSGTVIEIGAGLNSRFERVDNGSVRWLDLDLPDTILLRKAFFTDSDRRRMVEASVLDDDWLDIVAACPAPYFFVIEGVLVYLPESDVVETLKRIVDRFPGSSLAFDTCSRKLLGRQHRLPSTRAFGAPWLWACDDPRSLERLGLRVVKSTTFVRPPRLLRARLPIGYRCLLSLIHLPMRRMARITHFRSAGHA
jgi:O-methyltransferase involved in polyketide biosynthesis